MIHQESWISWWWIQWDRIRLKKSLKKINLIKLYSDLTRPHSKWWFSKGNPLISEKPRLVKYYNLARLINKHKQFVNQWSWPKESWFFTAILGEKVLGGTFSKHLTPCKFNSKRPWKMVGMEDDPASYWVSVTFQGRTVSFGEGNRKT